MAIHYSNSYYNTHKYVIVIALQLLTINTTTEQNCDNLINVGIFLQIPNSHNNF